MAKLKLAAIGDSLSQGFQSGAIKKTTWSFPAIVARSFGLDVPGDFVVPHEPGPGLPLNLEDLLRRLATRVGPELGLEALSRALLEIPHYLDELEDYYERGPGSRAPKFRGAYHNVAVWGFSLAEALRLTSKRCRRAIEDGEGWIEDDFLGLPSGPMYRTAQRVLNPADESGRRTETQLDALERSIRERQGVDVLLLWLGANDALGTVLTLDLKDMAGIAPAELPRDPVALLQWNLTSEARFREDYAKICGRVADILQRESPATKVFVGTVPYVTIPPITRGTGRLVDGHFDSYRRFFVKSEQRGSLLEALSRQDVLTIESRIDGFNAVIAREAARHAWHLVDTAGLLNDLAVRRRGKDEQPDQPLRDYLRDEPEHPLLRLDPVPSILMHRFDERGKRTQGGLFSLDGIHPSTIGYGLIAEAFLHVMRSAGVAEAERAQVPWSAVIANDALIQSPPRLWQPLLDEAERHATLWGLLARAMA